jgi:hypothetical protein
MSSFDDIMRGADDVLFGTFGDKAIVNGIVADAIISRDVEQFGAYDTTGPARRHEATFRVCQVPSPKRGQIVNTDNGDYVIDGIISNDGMVIRVHLNES